MPELDPIPKENKLSTVISHLEGEDSEENMLDLLSHMFSLMAEDQGWIDAAMNPPTYTPGTLKNPFNLPDHW